MAEPTYNLYPVTASSDRREGLMVKLSRIRGVTKKGSLKSPYVFQCPPLDEFTTNYAHERTTYRAKAGEFSRLAGRNLRTVQFNTLAVHWAPWVLYPDTTRGDLDYFTSRLRRIVEGGIVFRFQATHLRSSHEDAWLADWPATLISFSTTEKAGENDARYFDVQFQEWRDPWVGRERLGHPRKRYGFKDFPRTHTLDKDDDLYALAKKYYGATVGWRWIANRNGLTKWGPNKPLVQHGRFKPGSKITIPDPKYFGASPYSRGLEQSLERF